MLGLEHEFILRAPEGKALDARTMLPRGPVEGRRLDPGDRNAIRCRWGGAITCDGAEAEVAIAPVEIAPGFTRVADAAGRAAAGELRALLPQATRTEGFSTHINVEVPSRHAVQIGWLFARRLAPAAMLAMDRTHSPGLLVRPRPGRLEICGEFVEGPQLRAAVALITGAVRACTEAVITRNGVAARLPPLVPYRPVRATERFGWYVPRRAFGFDLYAQGRAARLGSGTAQAFFEAAWSLARDFTPDHADAEAVVDGSAPLPLEEPLPADVWPSHAPSSYGRALEPIVRGRLRLTPHLQTWDLTVLRVSAQERSFFLSIPAPDLAEVLTGIDAGRWDEALEIFARRTSRGRELRHWTQTGAVALFDSVGDHRALLRPERDLDGDIVDDWAHLAPRRRATRALRAEARSATTRNSSAVGTGTITRGTETARTAEMLTRPGKYPPPFTEPPPGEPPPTGWTSWWPWPIVPIVIIATILITVITLVTGGGGGPGIVGPSASASASASTSAGPVACAEPFTSLAGDLAIDCPVTEHIDPTGDGTWYEAAVPADPLPPGADIVAVQASMARLSSTVVRRFFGNTEYPCGKAGTRVVACGDRAFRAGRALVVAVRMAAEVPLQGEHFRIVSVMLDGSPPAGGFRGNKGADQDLYLGTDTTIDLRYTPIGVRAKTWVMGGTNPLKSGTPENVRSTGARAVIDGDTVLFFFPGGEFRNAIPRLRVVSQVSDISFGPQRGFASADVAPGRPDAEPSAMFTPDAARAPASGPARPSP